MCFSIFNEALISFFAEFCVGYESFSRILDLVVSVDG